MIILNDNELRARNRATVEKYIYARDEERLHRYELFTEDGTGGLFTTETGNPIQGKGHEGLRMADEFNYSYFNGWHYSDVTIYETQDPNKFWVECTGSGIIEFPAYEPTEYSNHYIHSFAMEDGLIKEYWEYMNPCAEMHALGIPVPRIDKPGFASGKVA